MTAPDELKAQLQQLATAQLSLQQQLQQHQGRWQQLARRVWQVQEEERRRLARELHDALGQNLTALKHSLQHLQGQTADAATADALPPLIALAQTTLDDTRALVRLIHPPVLDDLGLAPALRALAKAHRERCGVPVLLETIELRLPAELETLLYRIAQEALHNSAKYAGASHVQLSLADGAGELCLDIADDGRGFAPETVADGFGLAAMRDRAALLGAQFELHSAPGAGTRIRLRLPLPADAVSMPSTAPLRTGGNEP